MVALFIGSNRENRRRRRGALTELQRLTAAGQLDLDEQLRIEAARAAAMAGGDVDSQRKDAAGGAAPATARRGSVKRGR